MLSNVIMLYTNMVLYASSMSYEIEICVKPIWENHKVKIGSFECPLWNLMRIFRSVEVVVLVT